MKLLLLTFVCLLTQTHSLNLLKTLQLCPQILEVDLLQFVSPSVLSALCLNDVDRDEPIRIYNLTTQTNKTIDKPKAQLVSAIHYEPNLQILLIGDNNSTVHLYDMKTNNITSQFHTSHNNVQILGIAISTKSKTVATVGTDGQLCAFSYITNKSSCVLAHAFNASVVHVWQNELIITCGGDRVCKSWRTEGADSKIIAVKSYMLSKISKVKEIFSSNRRLIAAGAEGYQTLPLFQHYMQSYTQPYLGGSHLIANGVMCGIISQKWSTLVTVWAQGSVVTTEMMSGFVTSRSSLGDRVTSCSFYNITNFVSGHGRGVAKMWQL